MALAFRQCSITRSVLRHAMTRIKHKRVKHYHEPGDVHELTFSCFQGRTLLRNDRWCEYLARSIDAAGQQFLFQVVAFAFMPNHVHLLVNARTKDPEVSRFLAAVKRPCSVQAKTDLQNAGSPLLKQLTVQERPGKAVFRFWQEGPGYDRNLQGETSVMRAIDYIHLNPVRKDLCESAAEWFWSSARFYLSDACEQSPRLPRVTPLPADFFACG
ncbi:MAG: transposase [Pirellulales bacterium]